MSLTSTSPRMSEKPAVLRAPDGRSWVRLVLALVFTLLGMSLVSSAAWSQVPHDMSYQGQITDSVGAPLSGPVDLELRVFDVLFGGSALYAEDHTGISLDDDGGFSVRLGAGSASTGSFGPALFSGVNRYLEVVVDAEVLTPRQVLASVPWALVAEQASEVQGLPTLAADMADLATQDSTLQDNIDAEATSRIGGDAALETRMSAIEVGTLPGGIDVNGVNAASDQGLLVTNQGALQIDLAGNDNYDIWIQGSKNDSLIGGDDRNLAMLGNTLTDELVLNYLGEYSGGTLIHSDLDVSGALSVTGTATSSGGFQSTGGQIPDDIWSDSATWVQGNLGSLGTAGGYGLSLMWNGYRQEAGSFGVCVDQGQLTGEVCYQGGTQDSCGGGGSCVCANDHATPSSVYNCGWTLGGLGSTQPFDVISYLHVDQNGIDFRSTDYGDGDYPRKNLPVPASRMRITPTGNVGIGTTSPTEKLMVLGNIRAYGPEGGVISATHSGSGAVVLDPTGSTSGYTATLSLDDTGFKVGHNSASRDIQFQTGNTTRMKIATTGDVDIEGDIIFGPSNTSLTAALAAASGSMMSLVAVGEGALANNTTGESNVAVGAQALESNGTGGDNVALGRYGLANNTIGNNNVAVGTAALLLNVSGGENTAVGDRSLYSNTTGSHNTASGANALALNTTGDHNTASGHSALYFNTTGSWNTASGKAALYSNTTGDYNTATGSSSLALNTTGSQNTATGRNALFRNTTGISNTATGYLALYLNTTGFWNTATGMNALASNTTGAYNTAAGMNSLTSNTTGFWNTASGWSALRKNTTGDYNTANGYRALYYNTTGESNTASGWGALYKNATGVHNIAVGFEAGTNTTGSHNILIGHAGVSGESGTIRIGEASPTHDRAFIAGIRGITTGNADAVAVVIDSAGQLGTVSSSARYKEDIEPMAMRSVALGSLRPVTFRYKRAHTDGSKPLQYGLIAEEVAEVFPELVVFDAEGRPETVRYHWLSSLLLNEFQKLSTRHEKVAQQVAENDAAIAQLRKQNEAMQERLALLEALPERLVALEARVIDMTQLACTEASGVEDFAMQQK